MFASATYIERRARIREAVGSGVILLLGNEESPMNYPDNPYPFRQDSSFLYLFGLPVPNLDAAIDIDENRTILFGEDRSLDDVVWMGPGPSLRERARAAGVEETADPGALGSMVEAALRKGRNIHFLPPYRSRMTLRFAESLGIPPSEVPRRASEPLIRALVAQRSCKTADELREIEAALDIAQLMHKTAMLQARPGVFEREVAGAMEGIALARGGRLSFPTIFTIHGETLHNHDHSHRMDAGRIAINDSGAESRMGYASDITRTIPIGGRFSDRQRDIYRLVLRTQEAALEAMRPGVAFRAVHILACETLAGGLKDLGLMAGDIAEAVRAGAHALFFPHGLGHMLGLDVHDMEGLGEDFVGYTDEIRRSPQFGLRSLRLGRRLEPGFVVTVEPGLYFIPALIDRWRAEGRCADFIRYDRIEAYRDFGGIRIEDDAIIEKDGARVLGAPIAKSIEDVEALSSA
ncbi:MAG: aminopeptidase P family protein [Planctomycetes bacterium]|nr:aminopeptidase P family protein [Planctomycetota bacterium]